MYSDKQTVTGEDIASGETAYHFVGIVSLPNSMIHSHAVEFNSSRWGMRIQVDGTLWAAMRARDSRKTPDFGILYDEDSLHSGRIIPMYLQGWNDGPNGQWAIFGTLWAGAFSSPKVYYTLTKGDVYTGV